MDLFFHIILTSIIPILLLTLMGVLLDRWFQLDLRTLSKLNFYLFLPAYILKSFYVTNLTHESFEIFGCALIILFTNSLLAGLVAKWQGYSLGKTEIVRNATMFSNIGNLGVALGTFVFANDPYVINGTTPYLHDGVIAIIATFIIQTIFCNSLGFYQAGKGKLTTRDSIRTVLHIPIMYCVPLSILAHYYSPIDVTQTIIWGPLDIFGRCFVGAAMLTLGVQLNRTPWNFLKKDVLMTSALRLIGGPVLALAVVLPITMYYTPLQPIAAQSIIIAYAVPSAVNTALMAVEMNNHPELTTQIVLATTVLSSFTMPLAILLAYHVFPL